MRLGGTAYPPWFLSQSCVFRDVSVQQSSLLIRKVSHSISCVLKHTRIFQAIFSLWHHSCTIPLVHRGKACVICHSLRGEVDILVTCQDLKRIAFKRKFRMLNKQFQVLNYTRELHQGDLLKLHSAGISLKNKDCNKSGKNIDNRLEYP